ncbi:MAG: GNAT family N-acetyltransferase [Aestuariibaculum sp.]
MYVFQKAKISDLPQIWDILKQAIARRKKDGSEQWQDGYPNPEIIKSDIEKNTGFVLTKNNTITGYACVAINDEPAYSNIEGNWISNGDYVVFHRVAISENYLGKGLAKKMLEYIEDYALSNAIFSIKADTNFDNPAMLNLFDKHGYMYCGEVYFRNSPRKAYEKILKVKNDKATTSGQARKA